MDKKTPDDLNETPVLQREPEETQQYAKWMAEYGRPAVIGLAVAIVVLLGISVWKNQKKEKAAAAVQALFQGTSPEELQMFASTGPQAPTAPLALASASAEFYAQSRYEEAREAYQRFLDLYPTHMFADDAALGLAASQEALEEFDAAAAAYEAFAAAHSGSPLHPQAVMGAARCRRQLGQFDEARALYEDFIAANPESSWLPQAESGLLFLKKAERARDNPPPAAPAVAEPVAEAVPAGTDIAPVVEASSPSIEQEQTTEAIPAEMAEPAPEEEGALVAEPETKPKKKRTSRKQKTEATPGAEPKTEEPADE